MIKYFLCCKLEQNPDSLVRALQLKDKREAEGGWKLSFLSLRCLQVIIRDSKVMLLIYRLRILNLSILCPDQLLQTMAQMLQKTRASPRFS
jgi:hypothetical protein